MVFMLQTVEKPDDFAAVGNNAIYDWLAHDGLYQQPAPPSIATEPIIFTSSAPLPPIITYTNNVFLVSRGFKDTLESNAAANEMSFVPMKLIVNGSTITSGEYYLLNVLNVQNKTDWKKTKTSHGGISPKYGKAAYSPSGSAPGSYFFKEEASQFSIWMEGIDEHSDRIYIPDIAAKYMTDTLWNILDVKFPNCLVPYAFSDPVRYKRFVLG